MLRSNEGLTKVYNRFHGPDERSLEIVELRRLHEALDRAVLNAYGWTDIPTACEFLPEFDEEQDEEEAPRSARGRQKRYRYRWPDEVRDEVLARLLALNIERAAQQTPLEISKVSKPRATSRKRDKVEVSSQREPVLFE